MAASKKCQVCGKTAYPLESFAYDDKLWHKLCFKCEVCGQKVNLTTFKGVAGHVYCEPCRPKPAATQTADRHDLNTIREAPKVATVNDQVRGELAGVGATITTDSILVKTATQAPKVSTTNEQVRGELAGEYYNSSLEIDAVSKKIVKFGAVATICGGLKPNYSNVAPKVMYYSARGPDPEDSLPHEADILKPNLLAPGNFIWAAWSSVGTDSVEFLGENFALMSGTSMAAPHVAGLAALIRQKFPNFSPAAIGSALSTTASLYDKSGGPIMAQRSYASPDQNQSPATPFDMGSGFVNASGALNPGLVFDSGYDDYMSFLCGINGSAPVVLNYTGQNCALYNLTVYGPDLNLPSITISKLNQSRIVQRTVQNIAQNESYSVGWTAPNGVSVKVSPTHFCIGSGERQVLSVLLNATLSSSVASFGRIGLFGNQGHVVNIPLSVMVKISSNTTTS